MAKMTICTRVMRMLDAPRAKWPGHLLLAVRTGLSVQDIERQAAALAQGAAMLSAYADARGAAGCGDSGHEAAIKHAQKRLKAVRRAMGYTAP